MVCPLGVHINRVPLSREGMTAGSEDKCLDVVVVFVFSIYDLAKIKLQFVEINKRSLRLSSLKQRGVGSLFSSLFFLALCLHAALHHPNAWNRLEDYAKGTTKQRLQQRNNET